jgi:hypothetical protein
MPVLIIMENLVQHIDRTIRVLKRDLSFPISLDKLMLKTNPKIEVSLDDWEKAGLRVGIRINGFGWGYFNEEPYKSDEIALKDYNKILVAIERGKYSIELFARGRLKLILSE